MRIFPALSLTVHASFSQPVLSTKLSLPSLASVFERPPPCWSPSIDSASRPQQGPHCHNHENTFRMGVDAKFLTNWSITTRIIWQKKNYRRRHLRWKERSNCCHNCQQLRRIPNTVISLSCWTKSSGQSDRFCVAIRSRYDHFNEISTDIRDSCEATQRPKIFLIFFLFFIFDIQNGSKWNSATMISII